MAEDHEFGDDEKSERPAAGNADDDEFRLTSSIALYNLEPTAYLPAYWEKNSSQQYFRLRPLNSVTISHPLLPVSFCRVKTSTSRSQDLSPPLAWFTTQYLRVCALLRKNQRTR
jgi:hypothetical protein